MLLQSHKSAAATRCHIPRPHTANIAQHVSTPRCAAWLLLRCAAMLHAAWTASTPCCAALLALHIVLLASTLRALHAAPRCTALLALHAALRYPPDFAVVCLAVGAVELCCLGVGRARAVGVCQQALRVQAGGVGRAVRSAEHRVPGLSEQ